MADAMNILIVDDNVDYLEFLKEVLYLHGYSIFTATDGSEGLEVLQRENIHLIISDIKMPTLDGIMLHTYVREMEQYKRTKFIFISGYGKEYAEILDLDPGVDFFFEKTTPVAELLQFIDRLMSDELAGKWV